MNFNDSSFDYTDTELLAFLGTQESQQIKWGSNYEGELVSYLTRKPEEYGDPLPWPNMSDKFRFRPAVVTVWAGYNGSHKSMILGQVIHYLALNKGAPCGIMSFEMSVPETMKRMLYQAATTLNPDEAYSRKWVRMQEKRIAYYDKLETTDSKKVLGALLYMVKDMGCRHVVIDSLTKCGLPPKDFHAEKKFIDALTATAKATGVHIHLVAHVAKPEGRDERAIPNKYHIRGASEITDLVDNVFICWADRQRLGMKEFAGELDHKAQQYFDNNPDQIVRIAKQRNGPWEGKIRLYKHDCLQFTASEGRVKSFVLPDSLAA